MTMALKLCASLSRLLASRNFGLHIPRSCTTTTQNEPWHFKELNPFGKLEFSAGGDSVHVVQPVDPVHFPKQNEAIVRMSNPSGVHCDCKNSLVSVKEVAKIHPQALRCEYQVPIKFAIDASLRDTSAIHIRDMESGSIHIKGENASCFMTNIKSDSLVVKTSGPVISQATLHSNGDIHTTDGGSISLNKALGTSLNLRSQGGDISVDSVYVENLSIETHTGSVHLGSTHKRVTVDITERGNLTVGTLDGSLRARVHSGNVKLHITQLENCEIDVKEGDVEVQLPDKLSTEINIEASVVDVDSNLNISSVKNVESAGRVRYTGCLAPTEERSDKAGSLRICCGEGRVTLQCKDWFSSLGLTEPA